jgi:hypothetical protein
VITNIRFENVQFIQDLANPRGNSVFVGLIGGRLAADYAEYLYADSDCVMSHASETASGTQVGGLIGSGYIKKSMFNGDLHASREALGGGYNDAKFNPWQTGGTLEDCGSQGGAYSTTKVGSLSGISPSGHTRAYIAPASYTFAVTGYAYANGGTVAPGTTSYHQDDYGYTADTTLLMVAKTEAQMKTEGTYVGWDFVTTWGISPTINNGYPYIRAIEDYAWKPSAGSGTETGITTEHSSTVTAQGFFIPSDIQNEFIAEITSSLSNIDAPDIEKRVTYLDINFIGDGYITLLDDKGEIQSWDLTATERNTERLYVSLPNNVPMEKIKYKLTTTDENFKLYSIHIEFDTEEKDGGFGAFPENQERT